jgi:peptidoglycan/LPS O-acetylase OafA/YrhL
MRLFFILLFILYIVSWSKSRRDARYPFDKDVTSSLKGILCLLIVAHHLYNANIGISFFSLWEGAWGPIIVAFFFFMSGYGLMASYKKKGTEYLKGFFRRRLLKVFMPFFIATIAFMALNYLDTRNWPDFISNILAGRPPLPNSWFVFAIIIFYVFFYLAFRIRVLDNNWRKIGVCFGLSIAYILFMNLIGFATWWWVTALAFPSGMAYNEGERFFVQKQWHLLFVPIGCVVAFLSLYVLHVDVLYTITYMLLPIMTMTLLSHINFPKNRALFFLGNISYEVYLIHGALIFLLRGTHIYIESKYIFALLIYTLTIVFAYFLHITVNRLMIKLT